MVPVSLFKRKTRKPPTWQDQARWEARAPGWTITCATCGTTEPFGKYGSLTATTAENRRQLSRCPHCGNFGWAHIEKTEWKFF